MASIFSQDNPFNDFMSTVGDMAMISIAWTICSIPVVTVGASTAAACEVARELQSGSARASSAASGRLSSAASRPRLP